MPTGWRPKDVENLHPITTVDSKSQIKYQTKNSYKLIIWSFFQMAITGSLMLLMFTIASKISNITLFFLALEDGLYRYELESHKEYETPISLFMIPEGYEVISFEEFMESDIH